MREVVCPNDYNITWVSAEDHQKQLSDLWTPPATFSSGRWLKLLRIVEEENMERSAFQRKIQEVIQVIQNNKNF